MLEGTSMVFTITTYWKAPQWCFTIITYYNLERHLYDVYIITYYKPVRRHLYGVYHHNLLQSC